MSKQLHEVIIEAMTAKGLSPLDLAFYSRVGVAVIYRLMRNDHHNPRFETLLCLAIALDVPVGELAEAAKRSYEAHHKMVDTLTVLADNGPTEEPA